jgi:hypothetical protein
MCSDLLEDGVEAEIMWIPSDVELEGNDIVTELSNRIKKNQISDFRNYFSSLLKIVFAPFCGRNLKWLPCSMALQGFFNILIKMVLKNET